MGDYYVSKDKQSSGGKFGVIVIAIVIGIIAIPFFGYALGSLKYSRLVGYAIIVIVGNIPIALFGQKVGKLYQSFKNKMLGNTADVTITRDYSDIIFKRYLGAIIFTVIFDFIILLFFSPNF